MFAIALFSLCLGIGDDVQPSPKDLLASYAAEREKTPRDADSQVRLALWCEHQGLLDQRAQHLARAILANPAHLTARALLGQVSDGGRWVKAADLTDRIAADSKRAEAIAAYNARRANTPLEASPQFMLAVWCEEHGLRDEAVAHFTTVVRLDPSHESAWRKLGCKKYQGRWLNQRQVAALEAEGKAQERAEKQLAPAIARMFIKIRGGTSGMTFSDLDHFADPRAVPTIWNVLASKGELGQRAALRLLGQIDSVTASRALAQLAVTGATSEIRREAAENLRSRDRREYLPVLIQQVYKPLRYELRPNPQNNSVELYVEGVAYDLQRNYDYPRVDGDPRRFFDPYFEAGGTRPGSLLTQALIQRTLAGNSADPRLVDALRGAVQKPNMSIEDLQARAAVSNFIPGAAPGGLVGAGNQANDAAILNTTAERALQARENQVAQNVQRFQAAVDATDERIRRDCAEIDSLNGEYHEQNKRVLPVLSELTGQDLGADPEAWTRWWTDEQGYAYRSTPKPVVSEFVAAPQPLVSAGACSSCFAAGTPVHTIDGLRAIEEISIGDKVLALDPWKGTLQYEAVIGAWHNPPDQTYRLKIGDETVVATAIHRFWKPGKGWVMTRDLRPGDQLRTHNGVVAVHSIERAVVEPVYNLEVTASRSFFVGELGVLVHDYSLIENANRPFDSLVGAVSKP